MSRTSARSRPPGPNGYPVVGSTPAFARDPLEFVSEVAAEYGPIARYEVGRQPIYQVSDPDLVEHVLVGANERYVKGEVFQEALRPVVGNGLLTSEGSFWRHQRRALQPAFHPDAIRRNADVVTAHTERLLDAWRDGDRRDVHEDMMGLTVGITADALFGVDIRAEETAIGDALETVMDHSGTRMRRPFDVPRWVPTPGNYRYRRAVERLARVVGRIVHEYRSGEAEADSTDVVSLLLDATGPDGEPLSERQVRDEVVTILLAGHETTALALTYTLYTLGRNDECAERLRDEVDDVLGGRRPTFEDLDDLRYTEQVVTEGLRLYPPAWNVIRESTEPDELGGYRIPAGSTVAMHQWVLHRDDRFYDEPWAFRPDRWTEAFQRSLPRFAYFPFGGGPRRCIGDRFALMEARLALATILREWETLPVDPLSFSPSITLRPDGPVETVLRRR